MKTPKEIIKAYQDAQNANDTDLAMSFFAPNIRYEMVGLWVMQGLEELRALAEWNTAVSNQLVLGKIKMRHNRLECQAKETNDWLKMVGIDAVYYDTIKYEFEDDKISVVRAKIAPKSEMAMDRATNRVMRWALEACPEEIKEIMPRGLFKYGGETAKKWLALLKDWKQQAA